MKVVCGLEEHTYYNGRNGHSSELVVTIKIQEKEEAKEAVKKLSMLVCSLSLEPSQVTRIVPLVYTLRLNITFSLITPFVNPKRGKFLSLLSQAIYKYEVFPAEAC